MGRKGSQKIPKNLAGILAKISLPKVTTVVLFVSAFALLYLTRLGSFVRGDTKYETPRYLGISDTEVILQNIAFGPVKFVQSFMLKIDEPNSTLQRLVSAGLVLLALIVFYRVVYKWRESSRIAIIATALFATSAYVLSIGRFAGAEAAYLLVVPLLIQIGTWLKSKRFIERILLAFPIIALLLYVPGVLAILTILAIAFRKRIKLALRFASNKSIVIGLGLFTILVLPIIVALAKYPGQIYQFLGIDRLTDSGIMAVGKQFLTLLNELFYHGPNEPHKWLVGTPILDIATILFVMLGVIALKKSVHTLRARLITFFAIITIIIFCLSTMATVAIVLPVIYLVVARGIAYSLQNWFTVFPRNPAAKTIGIVVILIPITFICYYNCQKYFVAWHNAPQTSQALEQNR